MHRRKVKGSQLIPVVEKHTDSMLPPFNSCASLRQALHVAEGPGAAVLDCPFKPLSSPILSCSSNSGDSGIVVDHQED